MFRSFVGTNGLLIEQQNAGSFLTLKNNGYVIIHVPIEKMSEEIIKLALENNSYILLHIPESKITDDIINFVIEKDGYNYNILQYLFL